MHTSIHTHTHRWTCTSAHWRACTHQQTDVCTHTHRVSGALQPPLAQPPCRPLCCPSRPALPTASFLARVPLTLDAGQPPSPHRMQRVRGPDLPTRLGGWDPPLCPWSQMFMGHWAYITRRCMSTAPAPAPAPWPWNQTPGSPAAAPSSDCCPELLVWLLTCPPPLMHVCQGSRAQPLGSPSHLYPEIMGPWNPGLQVALMLAQGSHH